MARKYGSFYFLTVLLLLGFGPARGENTVATVELKPRAGVEIYEEHTGLMGTDVAILIAGESEDTARRAIRAGFTEIKRIEDLMTDWRDSPLEEINRHAGKNALAVDDEILFVINESIKVSKLTRGKFDITYAGVGRLWDFKKDPPDLPAEAAIGESLKKVGYDRIQIDLKNKTVFLPEEGMRIGLGGIAKGYAVDRAVQLIKKMGIRNFAVNAGGDLTVRGRKGGQLWWVAIRHPRNKAENIALLPISNGSVVTSGDSERYFILGGDRYSHILDPTTGYPASQCQSVTLIAKHAYLADALATGVFVMGPKQGMRFIESQDHLEGMIVDAVGNIHVSSGLQKSEAAGERTL